MPLIVVNHCESHREQAKKAASDMHQHLCSVDTVKPETVKSRTVVSENLLAGPDLKPNSFVHVDVHLMQGRDLSIRQHMANELMKILRVHFPDGQASVEVREREVFVK